VTADARFTVVSVIDVAAESVAVFRAYEARVLPLLEQHGGRLDRRLRTPEGTTEVHVLSFTSEAAYRSYLADPERADRRSTLHGIELTHRVVESLSDVP
jgi:uncharacterized protein (DUF1330 family)